MSGILSERYGPVSILLPHYFQFHAEREKIWGAEACRYSRFQYLLWDGEEIEIAFPWCQAVAPLTYAEIKELFEEALGMTLLCPYRWQGLRGMCRAWAVERYGPEWFRHSGGWSERHYDTKPVYDSGTGFQFFTVAQARAYVMRTGMRDAPVRCVECDLPWYRWSEEWRDGIERTLQGFPLRVCSGACTQAWHRKRAREMKAEQRRRRDLKKAQHTLQEVRRWLKNHRQMERAASDPAV